MHVSSQRVSRISPGTIAVLNQFLHLLYAFVTFMGYHSLQIQYFGLQYRTKEERFEWVDRDKPLRKQLEKYSISSARNAELQFGVQFYTTDVTTLKFEITRSACICDCVHSL